MNRRLRRTMLYIPGNNPRLIENAKVFGADSLILDLEDSVPITEKDAARIIVQNALRYINFQGLEIVVRINPIGTPFFDKDLEFIVPLRPDGVRLPKSGNVDFIHIIDQKVLELEKQHGIDPYSIKFHLMLETAEGITRAYELAKSCPQRVEVLSIGGEDFTAELGVERTKEGQELSFARSQVVVAARSAGIDAIDTVFADINDEAGLIAETRRIKSMGFDGKAVINPRQIDPIHEVFAPTPKEISYAQRVINVAQEAERRHLGVTALDGKMIDRPVVARAERILALARKLGRV